MGKTLDDLLITSLVAVNNLVGAGTIPYVIYKMIEPYSENIRKYAGLIGLFAAKGFVPGFIGGSLLYLGAKATSEVWKSRRVVWLDTVPHREQEVVRYPGGLI